MELIKTTSISLENNNILMNSIVNSEGKQLNIYIRETDGYINATEMCKSAGKTWSNYIKNKSSDDYINELSNDIGISRLELISMNNINNANFDERSTWVHQDIALHLATWLSPVFMRQCMKIIKLYAKGELKVSNIEAQIAQPVQSTLTFDCEIQQNVKKCNSIIDPECWLYIRGIHTMLYDHKDTNIIGDKTRKFTKHLLKFGIADNLGKRDYTYGKDNGMFYYAFQLSSRKDAKYIEDLLRAKLKPAVIDKTYEYLDVTLLKDYYQFYKSNGEYEENIKTYQYLAKTVFADMLMQITQTFPNKYNDKRGYELSIFEKQPTIDAMFTGNSSKITDMEHLEYKQSPIDQSDIEELQQYLLSKYLKPGCKLKENRVETFDVYIQCTPEMIADEINRKAEVEILPNGNWAYQPPRPNYKTIIQRIDPNDLTRVDKYYLSLSEASEDNKCSQGQIYDAIRDTRIINGFRWNRIDKNEDPLVVPPDFPETIIRGEKNTGEPVCRINPVTYAIEKIYPSQRQAGENVDVHYGAICNALKNQSKSAGKYWTLLKNCTEKQVQDYENIFGKWEPPPDPRDRSVKQIDPSTGIVVQRFSGINAVMDTLHCSGTKIRQAIDSKGKFRGFLWELEKNTR